MPELECGLTGQALLVVSTADTAQAVGSGAVRVLGTPVMIALMEQASVEATAACLAPNQVTVGTQIDVQHTAATPVGMHVTAQATLVAIEGRRLSFRVEAWDEREPIGHGTHQRVIVDLAKFQQRADSKGLSEGDKEQ